MGDLPKIPCYRSNNCGSIFQCGSDLCEPNDPICYQTIGDKQKPAGFQGECWGWDINTCDGILACCDPKVSPFNCQPNRSDPAINTMGFPLGCKIGEPPQGSCSIPGMDVCLEFQNNYDTETPQCQTNCWDSGGKYIVANECQKLTTQYKCDAMPYFCKWDNGRCNAIGEDPLTAYFSLHGEYPPPQSTKLSVVRDCAVLGLEHGKDCVESPTLPDTLDATLTCSQSSWDSKKITSYDPRTRICCLETCANNNNCTKQCITTPRCQFVENACECSIRDGVFMCNNILYRNQYTDDDGTKIVQGTGYCTWCQNQSKHPQELPGSPTQRQPTEWLEDGRCVNRCEGFNQCEVRKYTDPKDGTQKNSEELWNQCIWDSGLTQMAVDPQTLVGLSDQEKTQKLRENGFCLGSNSTKNILDVVSKCEKELEYMGSISGTPTQSPGSGDVPRCTWSYTWVHKCQPRIQNSPQLAENYLCTWCPSLVCKQGKKESICSSLDLVGTCTTDSNHGAMVGTRWDRNCGCPTPELQKKINQIGIGVGIGGGLVALSSFLGLVVILAKP